MDLLELEGIVDAGQETQRVEFKKACHWGGVPDLRVKLAFTAIAMANTRDGGIIVIGLREQPSKKGQFTLDTLSTEQLDSFAPDDVKAFVNARAELHLELEISRHVVRATNLVVIAVREFRDYPIRVAKNLEYDGKTIAYSGDMPVRRRRIPETVRCPSPDEYRELLDIAADKQSHRFGRILQSALGWATAGSQPTPDDTALFNAQLGSLAV